MCSSYQLLHDGPGHTCLQVSEEQLDRFCPQLSGPLQGHVDELEDQSSCHNTQ